MLRAASKGNQSDAVASAMTKTRVKSPMRWSPKATGCGEDSHPRGREESQEFLKTVTETTPGKSTGYTELKHISTKFLNIHGSRENPFQSLFEKQFSFKKKRSVGLTTLKHRTSYNHHSGAQRSHKHTPVTHVSALHRKPQLR